MRLHIRQEQLNPGQWSTVNLHARESPVALFSGGYGAGKTTTLALMIAVLKAQNKGVPGLVVAQGYRALWSTVWRRARQVLRACGLNPRIVDKQHECYIDFGDGVPVFMRSAHNPDSYDGLDVGWALGDEARHWTREAFNVWLGRVRVPCANPLRLLTSTPEMNWLADEFNSGKNGRRLIVAPTAENARNLQPGFVDGLRTSYSKRMQDAVIDGVFTILEGAVYENLASDPYKSDWCVDWKYDPSRQTEMCIDPGYRRSSYGFIQEVRKHEWVMFDELILDNTSDQRTVEAINAKGYQIDEIWCDPAAEATQSAFNTNTMDILHGIRTRRPDPIRCLSGPYRGIAYGVERTRTIIGDPTIVDHKGKQLQPIRLRFARHLQQLEAGQQRGFVKDLLGYKYPEAKDGYPVKNEPLKDGRTDHSCDALRYWAVGKYLTSGLAELDHAHQQMRKNAGPGYRIAA